MKHTDKTPYEKPKIKVVFLNDEIIFTSGEDCSRFCPGHVDCSKQSCSQGG